MGESFGSGKPSTSLAFTSVVMSDRITSMSACQTLKCRQFNDCGNVKTFQKFSNFFPIFGISLVKSVGKTAKAKIENFCIPGAHRKGCHGTLLSNFYFIFRFPVSNFRLNFKSIKFPLCLRCTPWIHGLFAELRSGNGEVQRRRLGNLCAEPAVRDERLQFGVYEHIWSGFLWAHHYYSDCSATSPVVWGNPLPEYTKGNACRQLTPSMGSTEAQRMTDRQKRILLKIIIDHFIIIDQRLETFKLLIRPNFWSKTVMNRLWESENSIWTIIRS